MPTAVSAVILNQPTIHKRRRPTTDTGLPAHFGSSPPVPDASSLGLWSKPPAESKDFNTHYLIIVVEIDDQTRLHFFGGGHLPRTELQISRVNLRVVFEFDLFESHHDLPARRSKNTVMMRHGNIL
jgi:hypothetical protein